MATSRPLFNKSIEDIERMLAGAPDDLNLCRVIFSELLHRKSDRSKNLAKQVEYRLKKNAPNSAQDKLLPASPIAVRTQPPVVPIRELPIPSRDESLHPDEPVMPLDPKVQTLLPERPTESDHPKSILSSWIALEALSPQTYRRPADLTNGDGRCVALLSADLPPWERGETSKPNFQLYYQVMLGSIPMDKATDALVRTFGEDDERSRKEREKTPIAAILVNRKGVVLEENSVAVSSFAWALPIALSGNLAALGAWPENEQKINAELIERLRLIDKDGNPIPLTRSTIAQAYQWLVQRLGLAENLREEPSFVLRVYHYIKLRTPPEVDLLNSFYLTDLSRAYRLLDSGGAGSAMARYIGYEAVQKERNLLEDFPAIEKLVAPSKTPLARWPSPGGHPLVTLQQAAVNAARSEFASDARGIIAVNGPPGTGKTTLLRDIVAACVVDRATAMVAFDDPLKAFETTGQKVQFGPQSFFHLYKLHAGLRGHEVVVASSNNKAVENVSRELPAVKAMGRDFRYFKTISDRILNGSEDEKAGSSPELTWGLISAVLGNAMNKGEFQRGFWWDDDKGFRVYLKAAKGDAVFVEVENPDTHEIQKEIPTVVRVEDPPASEHQAKARWRKAQRDFNTLRVLISSELRELAEVREKCQQLEPARQVKITASIEVELSLDKVRRIEKVVHALTAERNDAQNAFQLATLHEKHAINERPGWLYRFFRTAKYKAWLRFYVPLCSAAIVADEKLSSVQRQLTEAITASVAVTSELRSVEARLATLSSQLAALEAIIEAKRSELGGRLVDQLFFDQGHEEWNLASPWIPDALHAKREDLFNAALRVQRAFIDVSAQKVMHNIGVLMGALSSGAFKDEAKKALLGDLWATLFMVVPVISTTFASVDRMLGDLPSESLGWLLIDEAGQATPQAAMGAIMRARRVIVVGDPLQIPPVTSQPERLVTEICNYFKVSKPDWVAPDASAQALADRSSRYSAEFQADGDPRQVGMPLLVHRRCQEPMFGISNHIAYAGQMVHAVPKGGVGQIGMLLGESMWFDINGEATSKWCPAEGGLVVELLKRLAAGDVRDPDIYIITPFRIVAQELRRLIEAEIDLLGFFGVDPYEWLKNRVGTIHTFQGKEAEAVIAVLGAPMPAQQGARRWATGTPNILNVMVSRAKTNLYVIGSRSAWGSMGYCRTMATSLKQRAM